MSPAPSSRLHGAVALPPHGGLASSCRRAWRMSRQCTCVLVYLAVFPPFLCAYSRAAYDEEEPAEPPPPPMLVVQPDGQQLCTARMDAEWAAAVAAAGLDAGDKYEGAAQAAGQQQGQAAAQQRRWWARMSPWQRRQQQQQQELAAAAAAADTSQAQRSVELASAGAGAAQPLPAYPSRRSSGSVPAEPALGPAASSSGRLQPRASSSGRGLGRRSGSSGGSGAQPGGAAGPAPARLRRASTGAQLADRQQLPQGPPLSPRVGAASSRSRRMVPIYAMEVGPAAPADAAAAGEPESGGPPLVGSGRGALL